MNTVYIHIGPPKTGSTAIQLFLSENRDSLLRQDLLYPDAGRTFGRKRFTVQRSQGEKEMAGSQPSHFFLAASLMGEVKKLKPEECWTSVVAELAETTADAAVISAEAFFRLPTSQIRTVRTYLAEYEVKVIAYLRDPFNLMMSHYNQDVKMGRHAKSFRSYMRERLDQHQFFGYPAALERWAEVFGENNVNVRPYEKLSRNGALERDIPELIGVDWQEFEHTPGRGRANTSLSPETIRLMRLVNRLDQGSRNNDAMHKVIARLRSRILRGQFPFTLIVRLTGNRLRRPLYSTDDREVCYARLGLKYAAVVHRWTPPDQRHMFTLEDARQTGREC